MTALPRIESGDQIAQKVIGPQHVYGLTWPTFASLPQCLAYSSVDVAIPDATATAVAFNQNSYDPLGMHSTSSNTSRITFSVAGLYLVNATMIWPALSTTGFIRRGKLRLNNTTDICVINDLQTSTSGTLGYTLTRLYRFVAGDYVELFAQQTSTGSLSLIGALDSLNLSAAWLSP